MTATAVRRFAGANIKGTPPMSAAAVRRDLRAIKRRADVIVLQEFRHPWYWATLARVLPATRWGAYPSRAVGLIRSTDAGQPIVWRRRVARKVATRRSLLHHAAAGISEDRYLRAVLLEDRTTGLRCWYAGTHFVVGGDQPGDPPRRRQILREDLTRLEGFLTQLAATGDPVLLELDANIHPVGPAYTRLCDIVADAGGRIVGAHGVEYLIAIPGHGTTVRVGHAWTIPTSQLATDHEVRGVDHLLTTQETR